MSHQSQKIAEQLLCDSGVDMGGPNPWDPQIHDARFYDRVLREGSLGLGESYMDEWWDCAALDEFVFRVLRQDLRKKVRESWRALLTALMAKIINPQRPSRSFAVGERHYDLGNDLYQVMLDRRLTYTCAYWKDVQNLDQAQEAKLDLVCRKLNLRSGQTILDIGCGWGSFLKFAVEKYGITGVGITVSNEQLNLARESCKDLPIEIRLQDYRELDGIFDHIVSLGMFEHVGYKNYRTFMEVVMRCLRPDGLFLLHTIGGNRSVKSFDPWLGKYIFPNSILPSIAQIAKAAEGLFTIEDWHNFSADYDKTLMAWNQNFESHWPQLASQYDERFRRMWHYYLLSCAGSFRARLNQLWQIVFSKKGVLGGYRSVR